MNTIIYFFATSRSIILRTRNTSEKRYNRIHVKYPLFLSDLSETWIFWTDLLKILKNQISWKSVLLVPSSKWRDGRTDLAKLIVFAVMGTRLKIVLIHWMWCQLTFDRRFIWSCCLCMRSDTPLTCFGAIGSTSFWSVDIRSLGFTFRKSFFIITTVRAPNIDS